MEIFFNDRDKCFIEVYKFPEKEMASGKADHVSGDQRESDLLSSIEDKHYDLIDEKGDHGISNKLSAQDITKELIARESGHSISQSDSQSGTQSSCTLSTIMNTGNSLDSDDKMESTESSDKVIVIDEGNCCVIYILNIHHKCKKNLRFL